MPLGIAAYVVAITGFTVGTGTVALWLGLPILAGTLRAARVRRTGTRATRTATGRDLPPHYYRPPHGEGIRRWFSALAEPQSWRDLLHAVLAFPIHVAGFTIAIAWVVGGLGGALYVLWEWSVPRGPDTHRGPVLAAHWR